MYNLDSLLDAIRAIVDEAVMLKKVEYHKSLSIYDEAEMERMRSALKKLRLLHEELLKEFAALMIDNVTLKGKLKANEV